MALEICVKAAVGAPNILGDCKFCLMFLWVSFVCDFTPGFRLELVYFCCFRPVLPESSVESGREENSIQVSSHQSG